MTKIQKSFVSKEQEFWWLAFSGKCGKEFKGNPAFIQHFIECEKDRNKQDLGREK